MKKKLLAVLLTLFPFFALGATAQADTVKIVSDTAYAPFEFKDSDQTYKGIDVDIINKVAEIKGWDIEMSFPGFDAAVSRTFAEASTRGPVTYLRTMIEEYRSFKPETYRLDINDGERTLETEAFVLVVANATQYGNNAYIAPEADLSDGLLDLAIIRPFPVLEAAVVLGDLMLGKLAGNKHYETERIKSLRIERPTAGAVHIDGEPLELGTTIDIKLRPHSLHVIIPQ